MSTGLITLSDITGKYKASGVYFTHRDGTAVPTVAGNEPIRLIAGFSRTGVFNAPVLIQKGDYDTARKLFGSRDRVLERQGSYFHKSLEVALGSGSVLALNLLKTNNGVDSNGDPLPGADVVDFKAFSLDPSTPNGEVQSRLLASYYNKTRFWKPDPKYLLANGTVMDKRSRLLSLANLSKSPVTVLLRKSTVKGFDITALEWYKDVELIPAFMRPTDLIKDYFLDVIVLSGDYGAEHYAKLSTHPVFGKYFTNTGLKKELLEEFLNLREVKVKQIYTGTVIPNFVDGNGINRNLEVLINNNTNFDGLLCAINEKELDKYITNTNTAHLDLIGNRLLENPVGTINFLSYTAPMVDEIWVGLNITPTIPLHASSDDTVVSIVNEEVQMIIPNTDPFFEQLYTKLDLGDTVKLSEGVTGKVKSIDKTNKSITIRLVPMMDGQGAVLPTAGNADPSYPAVLTMGESITKLEVTIGRKSGGDSYDTSIFNSTIDNVGTGTIKEAISEIATTVGNSVANIGISLINRYPGLEINNGTQEDIRISIIINDSKRYDIDVNSYGSVLSLWTDGNTYTGWYTINVDNNTVKVEGNKIIAEHKSELFSKVLNKEIILGDYFRTTSTPIYINPIITYDANGKQIAEITGYSDKDLSETVAITNSTADDYPIVSSKGTNVVTIPVLEQIEETVITIAKTDKAYVKVGQYLVGQDKGVPALARILSIKNDIRNGVPVLIVSTDGSITVTDNGGIRTVERRLPLEDMFSEYNLTCLTGFSLKDHHLPNNTEARVREIYSVMTDTTMAKTLVDPEMVDFRYFVDTFNKGLTPESKSYLSKLIMTRQRCLGILNCPTPEEFLDSVDPRFTGTPSPEDPFPGLSAELINKGGNIEENPSFLYTLPQEVAGASYVGYYFPNIEVRNEDGSMTSVPPACYVSNNFVEKYKSNPYLAVAGMKRGIISGEGVTGVSLPLSRADRGELEEKGINPIYRRNDGSIVIMGNETGFQKYTSILNNIHARETLINIEIDQEQLLVGFQFEYNDDTMRTQVLSILDNYYSNLRDIYGCIEDFEIVFDRSNNPDWVVRENTSIVDVIVKIPNVTKKFINRITLSGNSTIVGSFTAV